jgi:glycosyltransferase involved in cell wall biosynthesis
MTAAIEVPAPVAGELDYLCAISSRAGIPAALALFSVSVVIPTRNEALNLPHVFGRLPLGLHEVIVVDGNSSDDTVVVARELYPSVRVIEQTGCGKGDALARGFAACTGDVIVMLDADGSTDPAEIPFFVEALLDGADFAKGSRFLPGGGSADITPVRRLGNSLLNMVVNGLYGTKYTDLCYGYNAFRSEVLHSLVVDCAGFEVETLMNIRVAKLGLKVAEVPSFEAKRVHGESKLHPVRDGLRVLRVVVAERLRTSAPRPGPRVLEVVHAAELGAAGEAC